MQFRGLRRRMRQEERQDAEKRGQNAEKRGQNVVVLAELCLERGPESRKVRMTGKPGKEDRSMAEAAGAAIMPRSTAK